MLLFNVWKCTHLNLRFIRSTLKSYKSDFFVSNTGLGIFLLEKGGGCNSKIVTSRSKLLLVNAMERDEGGGGL